MATVTEIRESRGVTRVTFGGREELKVRARHFALRPLAVGDDVEIEEYMDSVASVQLADAYEAALTSLDFQERTEREVRRSLAAKGYVAPAAEAAVERLRDNRLLDDRRYAERAAELSAAKPVGVYALKRKLRAKGISDEDAEEALARFDGGQQAEAAKAAAESLSRKYAQLPAREGRAKLSQALMRRGFPWEAIREAVEAALAPEDDWE